jgi:hypothetical protein
MKVICHKPKSNINCGKAEIMLSKVRMRVGLHSVLLDIVLEFLAIAVKHDKQERMSLCIHDMILYLKDTEVSTWKLMYDIHLCKVVGYKSTCKNLKRFYNGSKKSEERNEKTFLGIVQTNS